MKEFIVSYYLTEDEQERLSRIAEGYKAYDISLSMEEIFEVFMQAGSSHDIDGRFKIAERNLGLRED